MEQGQVFWMVGQIHLAQWGNHENAAWLIGELAEYRAAIRGSRDPGIDDVKNVLYKVCDWWPNKPQDWQAFMTRIRPQLLADGEGRKRARDIFHQDFIALDVLHTMELFRDRLNFFAPDGSLSVINNAAIPEHWQVRAPFDGKTFAPAFL